MKVQSLFFEGQIEDAARSAAKIADSLRQSQNELHKVPVESVLLFFDALSQHFIGEKSFQRKFGLSLKDLADFLSAARLGWTLDFGLRNRMFLDGFIRPEGADFSLHAQPRGLVVEWLAGNIPFLGIYSMAEVLLTKNALLIKAPSGNYGALLELLDIARGISEKKSDWQKIMNSIAVVSVARENLEAQRELSSAADVRIIWGGEGSTRQILSLPKNFWTEDIVYGPKYSYAVVGREVSAEEAESLAKSLAIDVANFDQYACSSPHTVFVEEGSRVGAEGFAKLLAKELERVGRLILPKGDASPSAIQQILTVRADYAGDKAVIVPPGGGTEWTVVLTGKTGFAPPVASRFIFVKSIKELEELLKLNTRRIQTIGWGIGKDPGFQLADRITLQGGDRLPKLGEMSSFVSPWDGLFAVDRLVRWIRLS